MYAVPPLLIQEPLPSLHETPDAEVTDLTPANNDDHDLFDEVVPLACGFVTAMGGAIAGFGIGMAVSPSLERSALSRIGQLPQAEREAALIAQFARTAKTPLVAAIGGAVIGAVGAYWYCSEKVKADHPSPPETEEWNPNSWNGA